jgi:hypothetical protein
MIALALPSRSFDTTNFSKVTTLPASVRPGLAPGPKVEPFSSKSRTAVWPAGTVTLLVVRS